MSAELVDPFAPPPRKRYLSGTEALCERCKSGEESSEHFYECVLPGEQRAREEAERKAALPLEEGEMDRIRDAFYDRPLEDPTRYQDCFRILYVAAASIASGYVPGREQHRATQALREVMQRVIHGEMEAEVNRHG